MPHAAVALLHRSGDRLPTAHLHYLDYIRRGHVVKWLSAGRIPQARRTSHAGYGALGTPTCCRANEIP